MNQLTLSQNFQTDLTDRLTICKNYYAPSWSSIDSVIVDQLSDQLPWDLSYILWNFLLSIGPSRGTHEPKSFKSNLFSTDNFYVLSNFLPAIQTFHKTCGNNITNSGINSTDHFYGPSKIPRPVGSIVDQESKNFTKSRILQRALPTARSGFYCLSCWSVDTYLRLDIFFKYKPFL